MALSILFGRKTAGKIGAIQLDATISESHDYRADVTRFPVEEGADITDHIYNQPIKIDIQGFITNTPVKLLANIPGVGLTRAEGESNRTELAFNELIRIRDEKEPVDVVTGLVTYSQMIMSSFLIPRSAATGNSLRFSASFVELRKAVSETVTLPNLKSDSVGTSDQASDTVDNGKQNTSTAASEKQSAALTVLEKITGLDF